MPVLLPAPSKLLSLPARFRDAGFLRCCNGGTIINEKIPPTGDEANLALWAGLALLGLVGIGAVLIADRRRKKNK